MLRDAGIRAMTFDSRDPVVPPLIWVLKSYDFGKVALCW